MGTYYSYVMNVYEDLLDIRYTYIKRAKFCKNEIYKLKLDYENKQIYDKEFFKKFCPLNREKTNINCSYKNELARYTERIPNKYLFQDMIDEFNTDLL